MRRVGWLLLLVILVCAAGGGLLKVRSDLRRAAAEFGAPAPDLPWWVRWQLSVALVAGRSALTTPVAATDGATFTIAPGESATVIARHLQQQGLLPDADVFLAYLRYKGWDTALQAGDFRFTAPLTPIALAQTLRQRPPGLAGLIILPGWRREEVAEALPDSGLALPPERFLQATAHAAGYALSFAVPPTASLEGFLAPGRYDLPRDADVATVVNAMLTRSAERMTPAWQQAVQAQGISPYQGLILASIVQRETRRAEEMPLIAAVYLNRLRQGMPLEADPTVQYALGRPGRWWPSPLSANDLQMPSPYNTYRHTGLPPTPISAPATDALNAVAHAPASDFLFFRATCDGSGRHVFSRTFQEHLQHTCP